MSTFKKYPLYLSDIFSFYDIFCSDPDLDDLVGSGSGQKGSDPAGSASQVNSYS